MLKNLSVSCRLHLSNYWTLSDHLPRLSPVQDLAYVVGRLYRSCGLHVRFAGIRKRLVWVCAPL